MSVAAFLLFFIWGIPMYIVLTLLRRYTKWAFYIAQCIYCGFWLISHFDNSLFTMIDSLFPLWIIASVAALSVDKVVKQSDESKASDSHSLSNDYL